MKKQLENFVGAVLAGLCIGIGGAVFLCVEDRVAGALLFTVGLYAICAHGLRLYTGKVGYLAEQPPAYLIDLAVIWLGNFAGTWLAGTAIRATRAAGMAEKAATLCAAKTADSLWSLLLLGVFCGLLMFIAVDGYGRTQNPLILFVCVAGFILSGFEHCIADMFYFSVAGAWGGRAPVCILAITLGNSLGGVLIPLYRRLGRKESL